MDKSAAALMGAALVLGACATLPPPPPPVVAVVKAEHKFPPKPLTLFYTTFQDHAVLQRDKPLPLWGLTSPKATVEISFAGQTASATADAAGHYSIPAPPGNYTVLAFRAGYVGDYAKFPSITLAAGATVTTNLNLIAATSTLSGALVDSTNYTVPAVPDAQLLAFSTNVLITIAVANSNGNFTIPVTSNNIWSVRPLAQSAIPEAYLPVESGNEARFQTFGGPVSNAMILLKHANCVLYGQVQDNHGNPIPGVALTANGDGGQYDGSAISDGNGNYFLAMDAGGVALSVTVNL